jgi:transposase-like protein
MRPIYTDRFEQAWGGRYPTSVTSWRKNWEGLTAFFNHPVEFRRLIYTTNAIESLHSQMRKNIATPQDVSQRRCRREDPISEHSELQ